MRTVTVALLNDKPAKVALPRAEVGSGRKLGEEGPRLIDDVATVEAREVLEGRLLATLLRAVEPDSVSE